MTAIFILQMRKQRLRLGLLVEVTWSASAELGLGTPAVSSTDCSFSYVPGQPPLPLFI